MAAATAVGSIPPLRRVPRIDPQLGHHHMVGLIHEPDKVARVISRNDGRWPCLASNSP